MKLCKFIFRALEYGHYLQKKYICRGRPCVYPSSTKFLKDKAFEERADLEARNPQHKQVGYQIKINYNIR